MVREDCARTIRDGIKKWCDNLPEHRTEHGIESFSRSIHQHLRTEELTYRATNQNKCMYYSLFCSNYRKVADHFQLGLVRRVEALACLVYVNGPEKHHQFFQHLLQLDALPSDPLPIQFITYCLDHAGGSVMSRKEARRHRPHWMKPILKAELLYGLRVLLSIVEDVNNGVLTMQETVKRIHREVIYAGDLVTNHLLAVAVLSGLILPRNYLNYPRIAETLTNKVKSTIFNDDKEMTKARIIKGVELASESLGLTMLVGEHGLCEFVRETSEKKKKNNTKSKGGLDAFHRDQDFVWMSEKNREDGKISEMRSNTRKRKYRTEDQDRKAFHSLSRLDQNHVKHRWWEPDWDRTACLVHFVNECMAQSGDPLEVMYSSATAKGKSGREERHAMWRKYLTQHRIDVSDLPVMVKRQLHLALETKATKKDEKRREAPTWRNDC